MIKLLLISLINLKKGNDMDFEKGELLLIDHGNFIGIVKENKRIFVIASAGNIANEDWKYVDCYSYTRVNNDATFNKVTDCIMRALNRQRLQEYPIGDPYVQGVISLFNNRRINETSN